MKRRFFLKLAAAMLPQSVEIPSLSGSGSPTLVDYFLDYFQFDPGKDFDATKEAVLAFVPKLKQFLQDPRIGEKDLTTGEVLQSSLSEVLGIRPDEQYGFLYSLSPGLSYIRLTRKNGEVSEQDVSIACKYVLRGLIESCSPLIGDPTEFSIQSALAKLDSAVCSELGWKIGDLNPLKPMKTKLHQPKQGREETKNNKHSSEPQVTTKKSGDFQSRLDKSASPGGPGNKYPGWEWP